MDLLTFESLARHFPPYLGLTGMHGQTHATAAAALAAAAAAAVAAISVRTQTAAMRSVRQFLDSGALKRNTCVMASERLYKL